MSINPKQFARIGEFHLEEAILAVLLEEKHKKRCIGALEIADQTGIYRIKGVAGMNDAIVTGMLNKLARENKVQQCKQINGQGGWELTDNEFARRKRGLNLFKCIIYFLLVHCVRVVTANSKN
jgi:hypothetical protein